MAKRRESAPPAEAVAALESAQATARILADTLKEHDKPRCAEGCRKIEAEIAEALDCLRGDTAP